MFQGRRRFIMRNLIDKVKNIFKPKEEPEDQSSKLVEEPIIPGTYEKKEDVGKKVFEKTGKLREGVGQSSGPKHKKFPQRNSRKLHGLRERENVVNTKSEIQSTKENVGKKVFEKTGTIQQGSSIKKHGDIRKDNKEKSSQESGISNSSSTNSSQRLKSKRNPMKYTHPRKVKRKNIKS